MFGYLDMLFTYDARKVKCDEMEDFTLDTALVTDREWLYETAVKHDNFNDCNWIILEGSDTKADALEVHNKWLKFLSEGNFDKLTDCFEDIEFYREDK